MSFESNEFRTVKRQRSRESASFRYSSIVKVSGDVPARKGMLFRTFNLANGILIGTFSRF